MAKSPKKVTKSTKKTATSKTAPETSKKRGAKVDKTSKKKAETSKKETGISTEKRKQAPKKNGHSSKKSGSASAPAKRLGLEERGFALARSGDYYDQIQVYLNGIRPATATLAQMYHTVVPPATNEDKRRIVKDAIEALILEHSVVEEGTGYRAV